MAVTGEEIRKVMKFERLTLYRKKNLYKKAPGSIQNPL